MADVINRTTMEIKHSVHTPYFKEPEWMRINDKVIPICEKKYMKIVNDEVLEMTTEEKAVVDYIIPPPEPTLQELENIREQNIIAEIRRYYTIEDEIKIIREILIIPEPSYTEILELNSIVLAAKAKYPKPT